jgi:hypothetical protein
MFTQALQLQLSVTNHLGIAVTTFIVSVVVLTANFTWPKQQVAKNNYPGHERFIRRHQQMTEENDWVQDHGCK